MILRNIVLDAETYFDDEFSLRKMATSTYIRDPRFKVHGWAMKVDGGPSVWLSHEEFRAVARRVDWPRARIIGHNLQFDGAILAWHYGIRPALWGDTLGMARAVLGNRVARFGLDQLARLIGRDGKAKGAALNEVKGVRNPSRMQIQRLGEYACDDADDTWALFQMLSLAFPEAEQWVLDWSIRMFTEPKLLLDYDMLADLHEEELTRKLDLFNSLPYTKKQLSSNDQFADILRDLGYEPPTKISKATNKETYAFSKSDLSFQALIEEADEFTQLVLEARLAAKSTIVETRSLRFRDLAQEGPWAVPLNYAGAKQTKRFCLVGGTKVVVRRLGQVLEVDLSTVREHDLVWDGTEFVSHGGLAAAGTKEVITHDGVTGTKDHRVLIAPAGEQPRFVGLAEAAAGAHGICAGGAPEGFSFVEGVLHGQGGQRRPLRGGQSAVGDGPGVHRQPSGLPRVAETFDIIDCGPRNRFVANGKVVHNSGGQKQNPQNLGSRGPGARIRQAVTVAEDRVLYVIDSSNIELRTNAALAGQWDVIDRLVSKQDEYATFAGQIYHRPIDKARDKTERNVGKVGVLSLGYQSGAGTFRGMLKSQAGILMDMDECVQVVQVYRKTYPMIRNLWKDCDARIKMAAKGYLPPNLPTEPPIEWFVDANRDYPTAGVRSSYSGSTVEWLDLKYRELERDGRVKQALTCTRGGNGWTSIYGGKVTENLSQFLAREVVNWQTKRIFDATGFRPQLQVHDEVVFAIPKSIAQDFDAVAMECMTGEVTWWPGLITAAESNIVSRYGDAK